MGMKVAEVLADKWNLQPSRRSKTASDFCLFSKSGKTSEGIHFPFW